MENTRTLTWKDIDIAAEDLAHCLHERVDIKNTVVMAPHYGGWPVASIVINKLRRRLDDNKFKPTVITESELTRHFLVPLLCHKNIIIFDDVLDTGKVINGIIWRIIHECETFIPKDEILKKITICTVCKKRESDYNCLHLYTHNVFTNTWIIYPWE